MTVFLTADHHFGHSGIIGNAGWDRSRACTWLFSSDVKSSVM